jgi:phage/plasmid-associated DNA primase
MGLGIIQKWPDPHQRVRPKGKRMDRTPKNPIQIKLVITDNGKSDLENVDNKLFRNRKFYWVRNPSNEKQASDRGVFIEGECGLEPYDFYREDVSDALGEMGISSSIKIDRIIRDLSHKHMVNAVNVDAAHLIQTKSGDVIDLEAYYKVYKEGSDPNKCQDQWKKRYTEYREHLIIFHTGVDYPEDGKWEKGKEALDNFLWMAVADNVDLNIMNNAMAWIEQYLGRLLIGGNIWKEFVIFLGEKDSGKTTFVNFIHDLMGTYAAIIPDSILMDKDSDVIRKTLFECKDKRVLVHSEGTNRRKINTQTLKRVTGDSRIPNGTEKFEMGGKIIEDTNYAPVPDNPDDTAFNERLIIIPFTQKPDLPHKYVAKVIDELYANKEAIFAYMVRMSVHSMGEASSLRNRPQISERVKMWLVKARKPVNEFYATVCKTDVPSDIYTSGVEAYEWYNKWVAKLLKPRIAGLKFLSNEKIPSLSLNEFYSEIQEIHPFPMIPHGRDGKTIMQLYILREVIISGMSQTLSFHTQMAINDARQTEAMADMMEVANAPRKLEEAMNKSIEGSRKRIFQKTDNSVYPTYPPPPPGWDTYPIGYPPPDWNPYNPFMNSGPLGWQPYYSGPMPQPRQYGNQYMNPMVFWYPY